MPDITSDREYLALVSETNTYVPYDLLSPVEKKRLVPCKDLWRALMYGLGKMPRQVDWLAANHIPIAAIQHAGRGPVRMGMRHALHERAPSDVFDVDKRYRDAGGNRGVRAYVDRAILRALFESGRLTHLLSRRRADPAKIMPRLAALLAAPKR